jgi:hypothetical protein
MKRAIVLIIFLGLLQNSFAQKRLAENFDYPLGDSLGAHGWTSFSGGATNRLLVTSPGLSYAGYPQSGIGNATTVTTTGQDAFVPFTSIVDSSNAKAIYAFFLVNVSSASLGDYFLAFLPSTSTTFYTARVFVKDDAGNLKFGVVKSSPQDTLNAAMWSTNSFSYNTTYLVVVKYEFRSGLTNDGVSLFVFNSGVPSTEPTTADVGPLYFASGDVNNIGRIALRQGTATRAPTAVVDGIYVTTSWFTTVLNVKLAVQGLYNSFPLPGGHARKDTATIYLRNNSSPYAIVDSASVVIDNVSLRGFFEFKYVTNGTYYMDVRYRKSPIFRNGIETWSRSGGESLTRYDGFIYDFTDTDSKAYGNNLFLKGLYTIYNGDVNQDGIVDGADGALIDNDISNFASGYLNTDLNGDEFIDASDASVTDNNAYNFVGKITP